MARAFVGEKCFRVTLTTTDTDSGLFSVIQNKFEDYRTHAVTSILKTLLLSSDVGNFDLQFTGFKTYRKHIDSTDILVVVRPEQEIKTAEKYKFGDELCETLMNYFRELMCNNDFRSEVQVVLYKVNIDLMEFKFLLRKSQSKWTSDEGRQVRDLLEKKRPNAPCSFSITLPYLEKCHKIRLNMKLVFYNICAYNRMVKRQKSIQEQLQICYDTDRKQLVKMKCHSMDTVLEEGASPIHPLNRLESPSKQLFLFGKKIKRCIALVLVDIQNDFISGSLALRDTPSKQEAEDIIPVINSILENHKFDVVMYTQDWHPRDHCSFITNVHKYNLHSCSKKTADNVKKFDQVVFQHEDGSVIVQDLWPEHCIQGSHGADFHKDLKVLDEGFILQKGQDCRIDSYSAFWDNARKSQSHLKAFLNSKNVTTVVIAGLATDYCVGSTAIHAAEFGFDTYVVQDGCRGIHPKEIEIRTKQMMNKGVKFIDVHNIPQRDSPWLTPSPSHQEISLRENNVDLTELLQNFIIFQELENRLNNPVDAANPGWFELGSDLSKVVDISKTYLERLRKRARTGGGEPAEELFYRINSKMPEFSVKQLIGYLTDCDRNDIVEYLKREELPFYFSDLSLEHTVQLSSYLMEQTGANWDVLASKLGFSTSDIDHIRSMSMRSGLTYSPAGSLLRKIQQICPKLKVKVLVDALRRIERNDVEELVLNNLKMLNDRRESNRNRGLTM